MVKARYKVSECIRENSVPGAPLVTLGTTNNSVLFSETVHMQLAGWSDGLIMVQNEFRPDEIVPYNNFDFKVDIHSTTGEISLQFGVQQSNSTLSMYIAIYNEVSETWSLVEITAL
ncbi:hypothetical protein [Lysinibacillus fusiformis]|uniref:hypothetical protein n=1 Tax=Lysinibacillus fusiformis TaxID=28031 RepID=UPI001E48A364|nr:hypothetical protein [Lysinibacillus fusiformis]